MTLSPSSLTLISGFMLAGTMAADRPAPDARAEFDRLLSLYDRTGPGPERDQLATQIDALAGQRYATTSRLFWHTDLAEAETEARATGKPILSLRMLGRLDQDLSCANSRFFRVALYANTEVSTYLRDHFVLHWSSERLVPVARIDFGDGRVLERTIAGNSAHYILDAQGRPVDVLPGLYGPAPFLAALRRAEPVAARAGALSAADYRRAVATFHAQELQRTRTEYSGLGSVTLAPQGASLMNAERIAASKMAIEVPVARTLSLGRDLPLAEARDWDHADQLWTQVGERLEQKTGTVRLDEASRALFGALAPTDWDQPGAALPAAAVPKLVASFEQLLRRDSAYNELVLHTQIHEWLTRTDAPDAFAPLNARVYRDLFKTPAGDPWLGMATPGLFTGLPSDGVSVTR